MGKLNVLHYVNGSQVQHTSESTGELLKETAGPRPSRASNLISLGWGPRICILNKFSGDTNWLICGLHFEKSL